VYLALRRDPALAMQLIDTQKEQLLDWLSREKDRAFDEEIVAVVHRFRAAQVQAMVLALDDLERLAAVQADARAQALEQTSTPS
jgi:hypothetical protein